MRPGEIVYVPVVGKTNGLAAKVVRNVNTSVQAIGEGTVAFVLDKSGSMDDDRIKVAELYGQLLKSSQIVGTVVFSENAKILQSDEDIATFDPSLGEGAIENTLKALNLAATLGSDQIILITDEKGEDWKDGKPGFHKNVTVHCLDETLCGDLVALLKQ